MTGFVGICSAGVFIIVRPKEKWAARLGFNFFHVEQLKSSFNVCNEKKLDLKMT